MLGNGWYRGLTRQRYRFADTLKLLLQLNITDDDGTRTSVVSDTTWQVERGPITHNSPAGGRDLRRAPGAAGLGRSGLRRVGVERRQGGGAAGGGAVLAAHAADEGDRDPPAGTAHHPSRRDPRVRLRAALRRLDSHSPPGPDKYAGRDPALLPAAPRRHHRRRRLSRPARVRHLRTARRPRRRDLRAPIHFPPRALRADHRPAAAAQAGQTSQARWCTRRSTRAASSPVPTSCSTASTAT